MVDIDSLEQKIAKTETLLIVLSVTAIAVADGAVGRGLSLGPLYLIPLSYSALTHPRWMTFGLFVACLALRQWLGPLGEASIPWLFFLRDLGVAAVFVATVGYLGRLGRHRRGFFELARKQRDELAGELELAARLQAHLLELNHAPGDALDVVARTWALKIVGGDYYDFVDLGEGRTGVVVADVAGKGLSAALLMPAVRIALRSVVARVQEPAAVLEELNTILYETTEARSYATMFLASVHRDTGLLSYANAGHLPGLLVGADGSARWLSSGGVPLGLFPSATFESDTACLRPGGALVMYTDGVTDAENADGTHFGQDRLVAVVGRSASAAGADAVVGAIHDEVVRFVGRMEGNDDITIIAVKRRADSGRPAPPPSNP